MNTRFETRFPRQIRAWTFHCCITAAPSMIVALGWMELWRSPMAVYAILAALAIFIVICSAVAAHSDSLNHPNHALSRALKRTMTIRLQLTFVSSLFILSGRLAFFSPDVLCGAMVLLIGEWVAGKLNLPGSFDLVGAGAVAEPFTMTFIVAMLQGLALLGVTLVIGFFVLLRVQSMDRKEGRVPGIIAEPPQS